MSRPIAREVATRVHLGPESVAEIVISRCVSSNHIVVLEAEQDVEIPLSRVIHLCPERKTAADGVPEQFCGHSTEHSLREYLKVRVNCYF